MERERSNQTLINNEFYDDLKGEWYSRNDHPVALLRSENRVRVPWVISSIHDEIGKRVQVLDIGCGAGFLCNALAEKGHNVVGIDTSEESLKIAEELDETKTVLYHKADAYSLPFEDTSFDVVCAMDVLEHVEEPEKIIEEASRVLRPNGLFFFHTFNRNPLSYLVIIKGVEWFVQNTPPHMHVYPLFIKPRELRKMCKKNQIKVQKALGFRPQINASFWKMLKTKEVPEDFTFTFCRNKFTGYSGYGKKVQ